MLGVSNETLNVWCDRYPAIQAALDEGREAEHKVLFNALFRKAQEGNIVAAIFLLKARHGYREGDQRELGNRVQVTFQLPGPLPIDVYKKAQKAISNENPSHSAE